ncbi:DNA-3-methyladenine glycosylase 2 family protein [Pedobacter sp. KR3-3]|uniref:DNA-3-methyladenine glycosylase II n=1 Tax=Pedobacter albus TaxID=3113905 RepID=A0ABU7I5Z0_9SPHI|nr:DNA-3-methyladenine glycosylase 2 family protein [Pedobacter sp. KR3-3]MEE1944882.1 DNA-3-methyladenine glycosylase 2 family protein [Pedobacter sp. KR3-3]
MFPAFNESNFKESCEKVASMDQDLALIISEHGYPPVWNRPNTFESLVHIILEQQVSLASALATLNKLREKITVVSPENVLALSDEELRACYFSRQKTTYVRHLAQALAKDELNLTELEALPDEEVRQKLLTLKGIGHWTIDVYLIFVLKRTDIFPIGDLAAVNALKRIKKLAKNTTRETLLELSTLWQPYRTIATMLLWHYYLSSAKPKQVNTP